MSMRSQVYEWANLAPSGQTSTLRRTTSDLPVVLPANRELDLFIGGYGNNITKPAETTATQFVVIEDIAWAAQAIGIVQIRINTTDYFQNPDVTNMLGIPGLASPYPRGSASTAGGTDNLLKSFDLYPDVYVLPGQVWDVLVTWYNNNGLPGAGAGGGDATQCQSGDLRAFTKYTLYDGPDALIANKLLEMGISINPGNVDWYKRSLLSAQ